MEKVTLRKGKQTTTLTNPIQISAFINNGWVIVEKPQAKAK